MFVFLALDKLLRYTFLTEKVYKLESAFDKLIANSFKNAEA